MKTVLIIFFLTIQSSYATNTEIPATAEVFDTVQFFANNGQHWRVRTFARNQDVHLHSLGPHVADIVTLAKTNTSTHYGDLVAREVLIESEDGLEGVRHELARRGLDVNLEQPPSGAVFWAPSGTRYRTKSTPQ